VHWLREIRGPATAVTDCATTFSVGLILLLVGLICGASAC